MTFTKLKLKTILIKVTWQIWTIPLHKFREKEIREQMRVKSFTDNDTIKPLLMKYKDINFSPTF